MSTTQSDAGNVAGQKNAPAASPDPPQPQPRPGVDAAAPRSTDPPPPAAHRRRWPVVIALAALALGLTLWYATRRGNDENGPLVLEGNIDVRQVNLAFKVDGRIAGLAVDEGDEVAAGQTVAWLDKQYFEDDLRLVRARRDNAAATLARLEHGSRPEEIAEAKANVAQQRAQLTQAEQDYDRAAGLVGKGAVSKEDFDKARAALDEAKATLRYAEQALQLAEIGPRQEDIDAARAQLAGEDAAVVQSERRLTDADLIAPSTGVILTRTREKGAIVAAGEPVFTLTLISPVWVRTYVNERDLGRIEPGMEAEVVTDTAPNKPYVGRIGFISPTAEFTPKTVQTRELRTDLVYRLRVLVDNPDGGLRQGMPVTVKLRSHDSASPTQPSKPASSPSMPGPSTRPTNDPAESGAGPPAAGPAAAGPTPQDG